MSIIHPVLLAGGSGARLWPLSRKSYPKQFSKLIDDVTLFQSTAKRLTSSHSVQFAPHITLTIEDFQFIIGEQLQEIGISPGPILIEPEAKNTAAAILAASIFAHSKDQNATLLVALSDHLIPDTQLFHKAIKVGLSHVQNHNIVAFGVKPTHPETGYSYLESSLNISDPTGAFEVLSFTEKPDLDHAVQMLASGNFLWNAGIFLFRAQDMIDAFRTYAPRTLDIVSQSVDGASTDLGFLRLASEPWLMLENVSIDHKIMMNANNLIAIPYEAKWSNLGGWDAIWSESSLDLSGNVVSETAHAIDCSDSLLRSESRSQEVVGIGLDNILAVAMPDAVLVANRERVQDVKRAVELLKAKGVNQAETFSKDHRPWGWFESLAMGNCFQVKRIHVKLGAALSLQSHNFRSEYWIVVEGTAKVTIDDDVKLVAEGQSVYVPLGAKHRMENNGKLPMVLIEVQIGTYLGEDDIVRYEDVYNRS